MRPFFLLFLCALSLAAESKPAAKRPNLAQKVEAVIAASPALARAHVGVRLVDAAGKVLFERNARSWFVPASNTKLYSTALALMKLGPSYRFTTRVETDRPADSDGVLRADLRLVGGGDPSLSGRKYPYEKDSEWAPRIQALEDLADRIVAAGIKRIDGAVIGDDSAYYADLFPSGWSIDDPLYEYGAPVSALTVNDNSIRVTVRPGAEPGEPALLDISPETGDLLLVPAVTTVADTGEVEPLQIERPANTREWRITGSVRVGARPTEEQLAVPEPALYAAALFTDALERRGIAVRQAPAIKRRLGSEAPPMQGVVVLAEHQSRPLAELLQVVNKVSQNLHAELLLLEVSRQSQAFGSRTAGLQLLRQFLQTEVGLDDKDVNFADGSGMSRLGLVTPEATTKLLRFMAASPVSSLWFNSLPIGGQDGTLSRRFAGMRNADRVHAKTGSLSHVSALGGYLEHPKRGRLVFTVIANNYNAPASEARRGLDKIVEKLLEE